MNHRFSQLLARLVASSLCLLITPERIAAAELHVGAATIDITPEGPAPLSGQMRTRIFSKVESPLEAAAIALETREDGKAVDQAIMIACDLVAIREGVVDEVRQRLAERLPDFDRRKLIVSATHTHTAPEVIEGRYEIPEQGVVRPEEYRQFLVERLTEAAQRAWKSRAAERVGWGLGHAVVAQNRRAVYADGKAQMYGATNRADFRGIEGYEDHGVEVLCFWNADDVLIATAINIACPAQEVEGRSAVNADFWHPVRERLRKEHGDDLCILGWTGAAGDQSPHLMLRKAAEERMRQLRGLDRLEELARRIVNAWEEAYAGARQEKHADTTLVHRVERIELPLRQVTREEYAAAQVQVKELSKDPKELRRMQWNQAVLDRFESQTSDSTYAMELHVLRLGDVAIATNSFELFTDYGIQIKARSPALQTFVIQLAGPGTYLPSERAVRGGSYSAIIQSNTVGPAGGQVLVERTLEELNALWPAKP